MKKRFSIQTVEGRFLITGLVVLTLLTTTSLFAPVIATHDPYLQSCSAFQTPSFEHWLGCNDVGQDLFSELVYGGRTSLFVGLFAALYATLVAMIIAFSSGFLGGPWDGVLMRLVDIVMALPFFPLVIVLGVFIGPGIGTQIFVITLVMWAPSARELRSQVLKIRQSDYIDVSLSMGSTPLNAIIRHVLPELMPLVIPQFIRIAQHAILIESSLSFLGLGNPVIKSWGSMLFFAGTRTAYLTGAWLNWVLPPGICIAVALLSFTFIGFALSGKSGLSYKSYGSFLYNSLSSAQETRSDSLLALENLSVIYHSANRPLKAVDGVSISLVKNDIIGVVGESGCGKSTIALSILGLLRSPAEISSGSVFLDKNNLLAFPQEKLYHLRGKRLAYIPQNAMSVLNPVMTIKDQIVEAILIHQQLSRTQALQRSLELLDLVEIAGERAESYSHEISGGMRQRVVLAMALANNPEILIADEPTTGLDVLIQKEIINLLVRLKKEFKLSILFITHDLPLVSSIANKLVVMKEGKIVEYGSLNEVLLNPQHEYTRILLNSFPRLTDDKRWNREDLEEDQADSLILRHVSKSFQSRRGLFGRITGRIKAVNDISFQVKRGEVVGVIGKSGSGKTTLAKLIMGLETYDAGEIFFERENMSSLGKSQLRELLKDIHLVFQDPYQSMRNGMRVIDIVAEPLRIKGYRHQTNIKHLVQEALNEVSLPYDVEFLRKYPSELSGGQRQRISFARAIVTRPGFIIADEPTSMLDVSLREEILQLMEDLRLKYRVGIIFITHDLTLAKHFCDRLLVLKDGELVESGDSEKVIMFPKHEYTKALVEAVREPDILKNRKKKSA